MLGTARGAELDEAAAHPAETVNQRIAAKTDPEPRLIRCRIGALLCRELVDPALNRLPEPLCVHIREQTPSAYRACHCSVTAATEHGGSVICSLPSCSETVKG